MDEDDHIEHERELGDVKPYISDLFEPTHHISESDEQMSTVEVLRRMRQEIPFEHEGLEVIQAMEDLGFKKLAIDGSGLWLVKYR